MCGIATYNLTDREAHASQDLAKSFLASLVDRGRDAAGYAWRCDGKVCVTKGAVDGERAAKSVKGDKMLAPVGLVHTRWATLGTPANNRNNHPIVADHIIGVHNGHASNHGDLFRRLKGAYTRKAEVDSEAIFATIARGKGPMVTRLGRVRGGAALAWLDRRDDTKAPRRSHVARLTRSPLWYAKTKGGSFIAASTRFHLTQAFRDTDLTPASGGDIIEVPEGVYFTVTEGEVGEWQTIPAFYREPVPAAPTWLKDYADDDFDMDEMQMALAFAEARAAARGKRRAV